MNIRSCIPGAASRSIYTCERSTSRPDRVRRVVMCDPLDRGTDELESGCDVRYDMRCDVFFFFVVCIEYLDTSRDAAAVPARAVPHVSSFSQIFISTESGAVSTCRVVSATGPDGDAHGTSDETPRWIVTGLAPLFRVQRGCPCAQRWPPVARQSAYGGHISRHTHPIPSSLP